MVVHHRRLPRQCPRFRLGERVLVLAAVGHHRHPLGQSPAQVSSLLTQNNAQLTALRPYLDNGQRLFHWDGKAWNNVSAGQLPCFGRALWGTGPGDLWIGALCASVPSHWNGASADPTGGGSAHNTLPPALLVTFYLVL